MVIDDEPGMGRMLTTVLTETGYRVRAFDDPRRALADFERNPPDLVLTDVRMPKSTGMDVLGAVKATSPETPVVLMTAFGTLENAVEAMKKGAVDFIAKPFSNEQIRRVLNDALEGRRLREENRRLREALRAREGIEALIGVSPHMKELRERVQQLASSDVSVLVLGESGTGKELVARALHRAGPRASAAFEAIQCGALPDTLLESELFGHTKGAFTDATKDRPGLLVRADGGTVFLDEIGDMPPAMQIKILRFLQEREVRPLGGEGAKRVDVRVVAATHKDLRREVEEGRFREDLYYRLAVVPVRTPPLRERKEDIPLLIDAFVGRVSARTGGARRRFSTEATQYLSTREWPGNVRELENAVERALAVCNEDPLPLAALVEGESTKVGEVLTWSYRDAKRLCLDRFEKDFLPQLLKRAGGNVSQAAEIAGMDRKNLQELLKKHRLQRPR